MNIFRGKSDTRSRPTINSVYMMMQDTKKKNKNSVQRCRKCGALLHNLETSARTLVHLKVDELMLLLRLPKNVSILKPNGIVETLKRTCETFQGKVIVVSNLSVFVLTHCPFKINVNPFKEPVQTKDLPSLSNENQPFMLCSEVTNPVHIIRKTHSTEKFFSVVEKEIKEKFRTELYRVVYYEDLLSDFQNETQTEYKVRTNLKSVYNKSKWNFKALPSTQKQAHNYKCRRHFNKVLPSRSTLQVLHDSPVLQDSSVLHDSPLLKDSTVLQDSHVLKDSLILQASHVFQDMPVLQDSPVLHDSQVLNNSLLCYPLSGVFHSNPSFPTQVSEQTATGRDEVVFSTGRSMDVNRLNHSQLRHTAQHSEEHLTDPARPTPSSYVEPRDLFSKPPIPPRYPAYKQYYQREKSFEKWVKRYPDPATLCNAGFFFTNEEDLVRCYQCGIGLKDFSFGDDPLKEHVRHSRDCLFLKEHIEHRRLEQIKTEINEEGKAGQTAATGNDPKYRHPEYMSYKTRLSSFSRWPQTLMQTPHQLASAGFFYTGFQDNVRCFACDGGLRQWDPDDDPWIEHCLWFPDCLYVKQQKGEEYVKLVQTTAAAEGARGERTAELVSTSRNSQTGPDLSEDIERLTLNDPELNAVIAEHRETCREMGYSEKDFEEAAFSLAKRGKVRPTIEEILDAIESVQQAELEKARQNKAEETPLEENMRLKSMINCMTCGVNNVNALFLPCTHHRLCIECAQLVTRCPVCNEHIRQKIRTYMA